MLCTAVICHKPVRCQNRDIRRMTGVRRQRNMSKLEGRWLGALGTADMVGNSDHGRDQGARQRQKGDRMKSWHLQVRGGFWSLSDRLDVTRETIAVRRLAQLHRLQHPKHHVHCIPKDPWLLQSSMGFPFNDADHRYLDREISGCEWKMSHLPWAPRLNVREWRVGLFVG